MQISRHWRMNANRYRLEGFALPTGQKALQPRHTVKAEAPVKTDEARKVATQEQPVLTAA
jgi:hypothetical protein